MEIIIGLIVLCVIYQVFKSIFSSKKRSVKHPGVTISVEVSGQDGTYTRSVPKGRISGPPAQWHPAGKTTTVQGYQIPGGMIYVGEHLPETSGYGNDACLIDPKLPLKPGEPWEAGDEMGYWPKYGQIPEKCRGSYLKWLSTGRSEPEAYIGYVFLFFYGIERRLFVDGPEGLVSESERASLLDEVRRLLKIYGKNRSFRGYANNLLAVQWALFQSDRPAPADIDFDDRYCSGPFQLILAKAVASGKPLPADIALQWLRLSPEFGLRTPARRCPKEFRQLFAIRYAQKIGEGLIVKPNKTPLRLEYHGASPSLQRDLKLNVPDLSNPFILTTPLKKMAAIAEECCSELDAYSRFIGRKDKDPKSVTAMALLPKELMSQAPGTDQVKARFAKVCAKGLGLISVETLFKVLNDRPPSSLGKKDQENLGSLLDGLGYGMAPDVRFHNMKLAPNGKVIIFPHGHGQDFKPSREFRTVCTILRLGAMVSQIDSDRSHSERSVLVGLIRDNRELSKIEKYSLLAFMHWCLITPQGTAGLKQQLSNVTDSIKTAISHILVTVAHSDGKIDPKEVKQLEKLYAMLGLDKKLVTTDLHVLAASSGPVTVGLRDPDVSFTIPKKPAEKVAVGFSLNEELIKIREEETRLVQGVLEGIFAEQPEEATGASPAASDAAQAPAQADAIAALDKAHQSFFNRLVQQETWERSSLHEVCRELGLMVDGALEVLNEWAFERANAPLIDDGDPVYVDVNLGKEITGATA